MQQLRSGFTTGSCAAAAAKAAAYMLLTGKEKSTIQIITPKGIPYHTPLIDCRSSEHQASCAVRKDGGDDPDITTGTRIYAEVLLVESDLLTDEPVIQIEGGLGVGRITRPGLDQPVGNAAINRVPREMIQKEVQEICNLTDFKGQLLVTISVPDGERLSEKTFNKRLGIEGGISILGTTGIVEPMSMQAILDTIQTELHVRRAEGYNTLAVSPGNYGIEFMKRSYGFDLDKSIKCGNFIGNTIDMAVKTGFRELLLTGHIGKLIKISGGIMNTHSKEGDCRMELLSALGIYSGITAEAAREILTCLTTEEAIAILKETGKMEKVMSNMMDKISFYLKKRAAGKIRIECIVYSNKYNELGKTEGAEELCNRLKLEEADG